MLGRLIRVSGTADAVMYAVAEPDAHVASEIIRSKVCKQGEFVEDLGRVTGELLAALQLKAGEYKQV
jgi:hypothetical protein